MVTVPDRFARQNEARRKLEIDLFNNAGLAAAGVPWEVAEKVFVKAWEDGHASGEHEVAMHYEEIAEIVKTAYEAGLNFGVPKTDEAADRLRH